MQKNIQLKNVRLAFPSLFKKAVFQGDVTKFEASFLLDKDTQSDQIKILEDAIAAFELETFGKGNIPKALKRTCLVDGDTKDYDGYANHMAFKAGSTRRPLVLDTDKTALVEDDEKMLEGGCYVDAIVSLWYSDHPKGGKQILGNLSGVRYRSAGESFGASGASADDFDDVEDDDL